MPPSKNPELAAVQQIVGALEPLGPDAQERVLSSVLALIGRASTREQDRDNSRESLGFQRQESWEDAAASGGRDSRTRPKGLRELVTEKNPTTNAQRIAVFAYYRDNHENKARFGRSDLASYFSQARLDSPGNYDRDFSVAVEKGWIHEKGDESYITTSGIEAVERGFEGERIYSKRAGPKKTTAKKTQKNVKKTNLGRQPAAKRR